MILRHSSLYNGLVSYYKLDGNILDSLNNNNGDESSLTSYPLGKINQGIRPTNTFNYGFIPDSNSLNFGNRDFSISCWVRNTQIGINFELGLINKNSTFFNTPGFFMEVSTYGGDFSNYGVLCGLTNGAFGGALVPTIGYYPNNSWVHIVFVRQGNIGKCYANTIVNSVSHSDFTANINNNQPVILGKHTWGNYLQGDIDEVGFWNRALNQNEINLLYNNGVGKQFPF